MASTERLVAHYLEQAHICQVAKDEIKRNRENLRRGPAARKVSKTFDLAQYAWTAAAHELQADSPGAMEEHDRRLADALKFHATANERRAELEGGEVALPPAPEPDTEGADVDPAAVTRGESYTITDPDTGAPLRAYTTATTADGQHVVLHESTADARGDHQDPAGRSYTEMRLEYAAVHPSADSAREEMLLDVVEHALDPTPFRDSLGAVFLRWGTRHRIAAVPHDAETWRVAVLDDRRPAVTHYPTRHEAVLAACAEADRIAARLLETGSRVDELGALWLSHRAADARSESNRRLFFQRLQAAKADRVVDRYGQVTNDQLAQMAGVSVQAINKAL
jgi:hypothetical protein